MPNAYRILLTSPPPLLPSWSRLLVRRTTFIWIAFPIQLSPKFWHYPLHWLRFKARETEDRILEDPADTDENPNTPTIAVDDLLFSCSEPSPPLATESASPAAVRLSCISAFADIALHAYGKSWPSSMFADFCLDGLRGDADKHRERISSEIFVDYFYQAELDHHAAIDAARAYGEDPDELSWKDDDDDSACDDFGADFGAADEDF